MATLVNMNQDKHKRKYSIDNIAELLFFLFCGLAILYCLVRPLIITFEYIRVIQFVVFIVPAILYVLYVIISKDTDKKLYKKNWMWTVLKWTFIGYWSVYMVLQLDTVSIYYNYLMVLLYGLVVGYTKVKGDTFNKN